MRQIAITSHKHAEVIDAADLTDGLKPNEIRGRTLISLTSPGTEVNVWFLAKENFPKYPGYACVFEVKEVGSDVADLKPGDLVQAPLSHSEKQQCPREWVVSLPPGLKPEIAVFARLMGVSMSTLNTTTAHPPARVLVTGLGPVGNLAAQVFTVCGYSVTAVDPVEARRKIARDLGLKDVRPSLEEGPNIIDKVALHLECSGHEKAVLDGCQCVRKRGEVVVVGKPWQRRTEIYAAELIHTVFSRYVVLRSGWEWEVPTQPQDFSGNSIIENYAAAVGWLADGKVKVDHLATSYAPSRAQEVYDGLLGQTLPTPAALFDWRLK